MKKLFEEILLEYRCKVKKELSMSGRRSATLERTKKKEARRSRLTKIKRKPPSINHLLSLLPLLTDFWSWLKWVRLVLIMLIKIQLFLQLLFFLQSNWSSWPDWTSLHKIKWPLPPGGNFSLIFYAFSQEQQKVCQFKQLKVSDMHAGVTNTLTSSM